MGTVLARRRSIGKMAVGIDRLNLEMLLSHEARIITQKIEKRNMQKRKFRMIKTNKTCEIQTRNKKFFVHVYRHTKKAAIADK